MKELNAHLAQGEARHKAQCQELSAHLEQHQVRQQEINELLRARSTALAESEREREDFRNRLREQLKITKRLCRLLDDAENAAERLRSSARWQIVNPVATLKTRLLRSKSRNLLGYGHLEKVVSAYAKWRQEHPEIAGIEEEIKAADIPAAEDAGSNQSKLRRRCTRR